MTSAEREAFIEQVLSACEPDSSPDESLVLADYFLEQGDLRHAASALDRAHGLAPNDEAIAVRRKEILDQFEILENGIRFRYVPAGTFLMGSENGDHDEKPVHAVRLPEFWMSETTITWSIFCDIAGHKQPPDDAGIMTMTSGYSERSQYSTAWNWHEEQIKEQDSDRFKREIYEPLTEYRCTADRDFFRKRKLRYDTKPMVGLIPKQIKRFFKHFTSKDAQYQLPSEDYWEKAARGGLILKKYPWGDDAPNGDICDFDSMDENRLLNCKTFAPNGYGLYAMAGSVSEWTSSKYDSLAYQNEGKGGSRRGETLFRGGSWTDCAEAVTVSFRTSASTTGGERQTQSPTFGFRVLRTEK